MLSSLLCSVSSCLTTVFYFILNHTYTLYRGGNDSLIRFTCPVCDKVNMLIRQIRSFGSLGKKLVSMSLDERKPEDFFRAPTCHHSGSNYPLHGRVGYLYTIRLVYKTFVSFWRTLHRSFSFNENIEKKGKHFITIHPFLPPRVCSTSL